MNLSRSRRWPALLPRIGCVLLAACLLSGCIIVPAPHWHPYPVYGYYR
jgi:hypothetical protein